ARVPHKDHKMSGREGGLFRLEDTSREGEDRDLSPPFGGVGPAWPSTDLSCPSCSSVILSGLHGLRQTTPLTGSAPACGQFFHPQGWRPFYPLYHLLHPTP